jgi:hypothetical protein
MSPLLSATPEPPMSPQPGQDVRAALTQLCHPNRQGREGKEPSIPPPSDSSHHQRPPTVAGGTPDGENGEGGEKTEDDERGDGEAPGAPSGPAEITWRIWAGWAGREGLPAIGAGPSTGRRSGWRSATTWKLGGTRRTEPSCPPETGLGSSSSGCNSWKA